jgi:DNA helicase HerA-like ATPase
VVFLFALITYHRAVPREYVIIGLAWALFVGLRPLEAIADLWRRWRTLWATRGGLARLGEVVGHEAPGLVLIREDADSSAALGDMLLARTEGGTSGLAIALDHVGFAGGCWLRAIHLRSANITQGILGEAAIARSVGDGSVFRANEDAIEGNARTLANDTRQRLLGLVASDTNVGQLQIELVRSDLDLQEGSLVEVEIRGRAVLYQIIKGLTREEVLQEKNTRGYVRAQAKKIGSWSGDRRSFDPVPWLPQPNQGVLLVRPEQEAVAKEAIGHFPGTAYPVCIDPHLLVTHNAAILGILGVGKSFLALELVERMIRVGIKVVCLDLTNQYAKELAGFLNATEEQKMAGELEKIGLAGKSKVKKNVEEGGSVREFAEKIREQFEAFLKPDDDRKLRIVNPAQFEVWRQDSKPYQDQASMATLTPTESTRIITEAVLEVLQAQGMTDQARCCIVYEEAHSLIPEWNAVASDGDKTATNGTAKAILQGRKFGLGCLVITQRTANVTKSILNQCNTVFGLRVFDATGMEFLKNYIGEDYAGVLSTLEDRHAVVFGRASSCRDPVLTRLNDRGDFIRVFREPQAAIGETQVKA